MGHATFGSAPFSVTNAGVIKAESGTIGGFTIDADEIKSTNLLLDSSNEKITVGSSNAVTIQGGGTDNFITMGKTTFGQTTTAGIIIGMDATVPTFDVTKGTGNDNYVRFDGTSGVDIKTTNLEVDATDLSFSSTNKKIVLGGDSDLNQIAIDADDADNIPSIKLYSLGKVTTGAATEIINMSVDDDLYTTDAQINGTYTTNVDKIVRTYVSGAAATEAGSETIWASNVWGTTAGHYEFVDWYVDEDQNPPFSPATGVLSSQRIILGQDGYSSPTGGGAGGNIENEAFNIGYDGMVTDVKVEGISCRLECTDSTEYARFDRMDVFVVGKSSKSIISTEAGSFKTGTTYVIPPIYFTTEDRTFQIEIYFYQITMAAAGGAGLGLWDMTWGHNTSGANAVPTITTTSYMGKTNITRKGFQTFSGPKNQVQFGGQSKIVGNLEIVTATDGSTGGSLAVEDQVLIGRRLTATGLSNILGPGQGGPDLYVNQSSPSDGIWCSGNVTAYASDKRLKENILPIESAVNKALQIRGVEFDWKDEAEDLGFYPRHKHEPGLIAQEVEKVVPEAVIPAPFNQRYKTIDYNKLIPLLFGSIHELNSRIEDLETKIVELKNVKDI